MKSLIQILYLEDNPHDAELVKSALVNSGIDCDMVRVETGTDFVTALKKGGFDLILADYSLPQFDGLSALSIAQEKCPDVPFILVSGAIGEEFAIEILKKGATDYVHKDKLSRLIPAINRALREAEEREERKQATDALGESEKKYRNLVDNALVGVYKTNLKGDILYVNEALWRMLEFESSEEMMAESVLKRYKNLKDREVLIEKLRENNKVGDYEVELLTKTGKTQNVLLSAILDGDTISGMIMDITERKRMEEELKKRVKELEEFYNMSVGRELRMIELKKEIEELKEELEKYKKG